MKKILNVFNKEKTQKIIFIAMIALVFGIFMFSIIKTDDVEKPKDDPIEDNNDDGNKEENKPNTEKPEPEKYKAPCDNLVCSIVRHFYSLEDDTTTQEMSLIQIGTKYQMSKGITYKKEDDTSFDVLATLSGTVESVVESPLYGNVITIDHGDNVKSEYLGVTSVLVSKGDKVTQGQQIASSGQAEYDKIASNHLHFRVSVNGTYVDPLDVLNKTK